MNRLVRLKELVRVNQDNQLIVKKLRAIKPSYNVKKWDQEFNKNQYMQGQIRENQCNLQLNHLKFSPLYEEPLLRAQWDSSGLTRNYSSLDGQLGHPNIQTPRRTAAIQQRQPEALDYRKRGHGQPRYGKSQQIL
jgi:hypothetical protein